MEQYFEQTVSAVPNWKRRWMMALAWSATIALVLLAVVFASMILGTAEDGALSINWVSIIAFILCLGVGFVIWRMKDKLRVEYDYVIRDGSLEVTAILNNRRRVQKLRVDINRIISCGNGGAPANVKAEKLWLNEGAKRTHVCYEDRDGRRVALLELNDEMIAALKTSRELMRGAWRD